jgi:hypothetical protein
MKVAKAKSRLRGKQPKLSANKKRTSSSSTAPANTPSSDLDEELPRHAIDDLPCNRARGRTHHAGTEGDTAT